MVFGPTCYTRTELELMIIPSSGQEIPFSSVRLVFVTENKNGRKDNNHLISENHHHWTVNYAFNLTGCMVSIHPRYRTTHSFKDILLLFQQLRPPLL